MEQFPANNPNPVLSVANDGIVLYSNVAGEPLLNEWGVEVGEKLPPHIGDFVQRVISRNLRKKWKLKWEIEYTWSHFTPYPKKNA